MDQRLHLLENWLKTILKSDFIIRPLAGDASFRRYFRIFQHNETYVAMDAPPSHEALLPFIHIAEALEKSQVKTPHIFHRDIENGFLLLSDFGDTLFLQVLTSETVNTLYQQAFQTLHAIQRTPSQALPAFDQGMILRELSLFVEWFIQRHLALTLTPSDEKILQNLFSLLIHSAEEQPICFVHRDYHSRNLLCLPQNQIGVLDFQDAVRGPITYDLISLIRDCYIAWPKEEVLRWILRFQQEALQQQILKETSQERFIRWADWMGLQRHLKVLGIFSRLHYRDNKSTYLKEMPRIMEYIRQVIATYPELAPFHHWFESRVIEKAVL